VCGLVDSNRPEYAEAWVCGYPSLSECQMTFYSLDWSLVTPVDSSRLTRASA